MSKRAKCPNVGEPLTVYKGFTDEILVDGTVTEIRKTGQWWQAKAGNKWTKAIFAPPSETIGKETQL